MLGVLGEVARGLGGATISGISGVTVVLVDCDDVVVCAKATPVVSTSAIAPASKIFCILLSPT